MTAKLRFVFCSDFHLGALKQHFGKQATSYILDCCKKAFEYAVEEGMDVVVIGGDIADKLPLAQEDLLALIRLFHSFPTLHFHIDMGNHDFDSEDNNSLTLLEWLGEVQLVPNCTVYTSLTLTDIEGIPFCFVPHPFTAAIETDTPKINVGHFEVRGATRDNGSVNNKGVELADLSDDYWLVGHLHTHQYHYKKRIAYCGSLFQKTFGEKLPKGFLACEAHFNGTKLRMRSMFIESKPAMFLRTKYAKSEDGLRVRNAANVRYRLFVDASVEVPESYLADNPSVTSLVVGEKEDLKAIKDFSVTVDTEILGDDLATIGLEDYLEAQGLDETHVARSLAIVEDYLCPQTS